MKMITSIMKFRYLPAYTKNDMTKKLLLTTFFVLSLCAYGQGWNPVGARSNALCGASVTLNDVWAVHQNPGAVGQIKSFSAGIYYDSRFLTKELQNQALAVAVPIKKGVIMGGAQLFGYEQYKHMRYGVGYALQLTEHFSAGVQGNIQQLKFNSNYGSSFNATAEAGFLATISDKWNIGFSITNIGRQRISELEDRFNSVMRFGTSYSPTKSVKCIAEIQKDVIYPFSFKGAIEYKPIDAFSVRLGAQTGPTNFAFGFGYETKIITIDLGTKYHQQLGWTPCFGLNYQFNKHD